MQQTAGGLTLWTEGTTVDGKRKSVRGLTWEKQAKAQSHGCGPSVYCYCPMAKSRASKSMGPADRKVRWELSSLRWRAAPEDKNRSRAAWRCCIRSRTKNPRKRSAMPRHEIPNAPWRIGG